MDSDLITRVLDLAVEIQRIPAPTFGEAQRAAFIQERLAAEGLADVEIDAAGNVLACLPGCDERPPLVISAHTDTVFPSYTDLSIVRQADKIAGPGIGDNSVGVAGLFGMVWMLRQKQARLPGDLWLVANVGEEGLGNLVGMQAIVERFGDQPLAYIILEGMALGQVYHRGLEVQRYKITVRTAGGHSWVDFGRPSAIHELAALVSQLASLPLPQNPRSTLNVGVMHGGTSVNTIAAEAWLELDLRSESTRTLHTMVQEVETLVQAANRPAIQVTAQVIGKRPAGRLLSSHPLVRLAKRCLEAQQVHPLLSIGSTDANFPLSQGLPAVCVGLTTGGGAHTAGEYIDTGPLARGLAQLVSLVEGGFVELGRV